MDSSEPGGAGNSGADLRQHRRYPARLAVEISVASWDEVVPLTTDNISRGGLFVRCSGEVSVGTPVEIDFVLPDDTGLKVSGKIVHVIAVDREQPGRLAAGFGVRFDECHATDLMLLEAIAASNAHGRNTYLLDDHLLSAPAVLKGLHEGVSESTSAHRLVKGSRSAEVQRDQQPRAGEAGERPVVAAGASEIEVDVSLTDGALPAVVVGDAPRQPALGGVDLDLDEKDREDQPESLKQDEALEQIAEMRRCSEQQGPVVEPSRQVPLMDPERAIFGIDFGTSYTSIGLITDDRLQVLSDEDGLTLLPSVVCFPEKGPPVVGWPARQAMVKHPTTTFVSPKRLLGRRFDEPSIQPYLGSSAVRTQAGPSGEVIAEIYGEPIAIPQVCCEIFRRIAQIGERATGIPVRRVVIAAPVGYVSERKALRRAAALAGLEVMGLLSEPNAAAIAYGLGRRDETALVYDFGGGTFDCTVIRIHDNQFEVLGSEGDAWLGGDDFDLTLANYAADEFQRQRKVDLRRRLVEWQNLLFLAERAKRKLSYEQQVTLFAKGILLSIKGPIDLEVNLDRGLFDRLCSDLVERSLAVVDGCLTMTGTRKDEIDQIVLTGGVSRIPLVRQAVQEFFGREVRLTVDPEQAVVVGCAIFARYMSLSET